MAAVTISRSAGRLIAVKAVPAEKAAELEREAALLRRLDHPGLVRFVDLVTDPDGTAALHTEFVSSDTWATRPLADPAERAAGVAALASTVADLHDLGVAHGQLSPAHVLHGENDRPVVCSLTRTSEATTQTRRTDLLALADLCDDPPLPRGTLAGNVAALADSTRAGKLSARELSRRLELLRSKRTPVSHPVQAARGDTPKRRNRTVLDGGCGGARSGRRLHSRLVASPDLSTAAHRFGDSNAARTRPDGWISTTRLRLWLARSRCRSSRCGHRSGCGRIRHHRRHRIAKRWRRSRYRTGDVRAGQRSP